MTSFHVVRQKKKQGVFPTCTMPQTRPIVKYRCLFFPRTAERRLTAVCRSVAVLLLAAVGARVRCATDAAALQEVHPSRRDQECAHPTPRHHRSALQTLRPTTRQWRTPPPTLHHTWSYSMQFTTETCPRGADRTAPIADRRRVYGDQTIQSAIGRQPLQVSAVIAQTSCMQ